MSHFATIIKKIICSLFILWMGVLAPLLYFDQFAANHRVRPYRFALFEMRAGLRSLPSETAEMQFVQRLKQRFTHQQDLISAGHPFPGPAHYLQWSLGQFYLTTGADGLLLLLWRRLSLASHRRALRQKCRRLKNPLAWPEFAPYSKVIKSVFSAGGKEK